MGQLILKVVLSRWFILFASMQIMAMAGANYMFSLYSNDLKMSMGYDQATLNLVSFFKELGSNAGLLAGLIGEVMPPWVVLSIGATMNFFGYFMLWLSTTHHLKNIQLWQMCLYIFVAANSLTFFNTGAMVPLVKNFSQNRGIVLGLIGGYVGLSGAILTQLYHVFYDKDVKSLTLFFAWFPTTISFIFLWFIRIMKVVEQSNEVKVFYNLLYISLSLGGFLIVIILVQNFIDFVRVAYYASALIIIIIILVLPLYVIVKQEYDQKNNQSNKVDTTNNSNIIHNNRSPQPRSAFNVEDSWDKISSFFSNIFKLPNRGNDYTILQALFSLDMLLLLVASICGLGATITAIDNLGQIGRSLAYPPHNIATCVSLVSIWNYLGRVMAGFISEFFIKTYKLPRPLMNSIIILLSCMAHLLIAYGVPNSLYMASVINGFCFGAQCPLIHAIISEIFGLKYFSTLFTFGELTSPIGSYILNVMVTGKLYDRWALQQLHAKGLTRNEMDSLNCLGIECYKVTFIIITGVSLFGSLAAFILALRTWQFYKDDIYKKFKGELQAHDW